MAGQDAQEAEKAGETTLITELTAEIISAYVGKNAVAQNELPQLIKDVYAALSQAERGQANSEVSDLKPAVSIRKSITDDHIICLGRWPEIQITEKASTGTL